MRSLFIRELYANCRIHGQGEAQVVLSDSELYALIVLAIHDLQWKSKITLPCPIVFPYPDYYDIPTEWFDTQKLEIYSEQILDLLERTHSYNNDFALYISNLSALHKRRVKFRRILSTQSHPTMDQVGPRALLEYGEYDADFLANWLTWRKWIYDIDNRAAQETGYLFEPILVNCLGGKSMGAKNSPVKRLAADGSPTQAGRQVDCFLPDENIACELKLRVTIAASGQGRFGEELSFPAECRAAEITPVLLVLDPTPSTRLTELSQQFIQCQGKVFIGDDAWKFMGHRAGIVVSIFLDRYIQPVLRRMASCIQPDCGTFSLSWSPKTLILSDSKNRYKIHRTESNDKQIGE